MGIGQCHVHDVIRVKLVYLLQQALVARYFRRERDARSSSFVPSSPTTSAETDIVFVSSTNTSSPSRSSSRMHLSGCKNVLCLYRGDDTDVEQGKERQAIELAHGISIQV